MAAIGWRRCPQENTGLKEYGCDNLVSERLCIPMALSTCVMHPQVYSNHLRCCPLLKISRRILVTSVVSSSHGGKSFAPCLGDGYAAFTKCGWNSIRLYQTALLCGCCDVEIGAFTLQSGDGRYYTGTGRVRPRMGRELEYRNVI